MMKDDILNLKKRWVSIKKAYGKDAYLEIAVPVIYGQAIEDAEHITDELSSFLYDKKILQQINPRHEKYLIHHIPYTPQNETPFLGVQDFYNHVRKAGGYYGSFKGIVLINVTGWQAHIKEKYFDIFLSYLSDQRKDGLIPFFYMSIKGNNSETRILDAALSSYFRSARIVLETADLYDCMASELTKNGITIERSTSCFLESFIHKASTSAFFHGTDTIRQICKEVIFIYNTSQDSATVLDGPLLKKMLTDSGYMDLFTDKEERVMGFR